MKSKKTVALSVMALLACGIVFNYTANSAQKKTETKEVTLKVGDRYRIPIKKIGKYKITLNKKKIVSANKKGVIRALKNGKCIVRVTSKNKKYKYTIVVSSNDKAEQGQIAPVKNEQAQPALTPSPTYIPYVPDDPDVTFDPNVTYAPPGGIVPVCKGEVVECVETEDGRLNYKLKITNKAGSVYGESINYAYVLMSGSHKIELNSKVYVVKNINDTNDVFDGDTVTISSGYIMY